MKPKLIDVLLLITKEIAVKLEDEEYFNEDPELYAVDLFLEAKNNLQAGTWGTTYLRPASDGESAIEARKLLKRKKITLLPPQ